MKLYTNNAPIQPNTWLPTSNLNELQVTWDPIPGVQYTLIMYDVDAPNASNPVNAPFIHAIITNIPGNDTSKGNKVLSYMPPSPSLRSGDHRYIVSLYSQKFLITVSSISQRASFDLEGFIFNSGLHLIEYEMLVVDSETGDYYHYYAPAEHEVLFNPEHPLLVGNTSLSEREQAYCSCVAKVADKQPEACNLEQAWFQKRDGHTCYNPYSVCRKNIGTGTRACYKNYNYDQMTDSQLTTLANLSNMTVSFPFDRASVISALQTKHGV